MEWSIQDADCPTLPALELTDPAISALLITTFM